MFEHIYKQIIKTKHRLVEKDFQALMPSTNMRMLNHARGANNHSLHIHSTLLTQQTKLRRFHFPQLLTDFSNGKFQDMKLTTK